MRQLVNAAEEEQAAVARRYYFYKRTKHLWKDFNFKE